MSVYSDGSSIFFSQKYKKLDISFYPVYYVEQEYIKGNPFFGQCITTGISIFNSKTINRLKNQGFKITPYTYDYQTKRLNLLIKRIKNALNSDNEEAIRLISRFAKLAIITSMIKKRNRLIPIITEFENSKEVREILTIITNRDKYIGQPREYLEKF